MPADMTIAAGSLRQLIRGRYVAYAGRFAAITLEQFNDIVETCGGKGSTGVLSRGIALLVVGQRQLPISRQGRLMRQFDQARLLRRSNPRLTVVTEEQFLQDLGLEAQREQVSPLLTTSTLCDLLAVSRQRISAWVQAGLVRPVTIKNGVWHFDFQQVSAAKTLCDLARSGVSVARIRRSIEQLSRWLPQMQQPLQQLSVLEHSSRLVIRLEDGDVAATDGQFFFDFNGENRDSAPLPLRIDPSPRTAAQWYEQALEQEEAGYLEDAAESYRQALRLGGPDAQVCFDLANILRQLGHRQQAMERYHQVLEIDPQYADAWNNLGLVLSELDRPEEALSGFRRCLQIDPHNARAHYNLADLLDEMDCCDEALAHWQAYLREDPFSEWADHARRRLARCS